MADGLLLLHAWPLDARMWEPQTRSLAEGLAVATPDRLIAPEISAEMAGQIPGARLESLQGAGHLSNLEAPAAFNTLLAEHLAACGIR